MTTETITYFAVEHLNFTRPSHGRWARSNYGRMLFAGLSFDERSDKNARAVGYRKLIKPTHECWQQTRASEFLYYDDALAMLKALRLARKDTRFRLVVCAEATTTEVLA